MSTTTPVASNADPARLAPEAVIAQLRTLRSQIDDAAPMSKEQRTLVKQRLRMQPKAVVEASINVIGVLENVSQAIGQPLDDVRQLQDDSLRWDAVAEEARAFLSGIEGANLNRHQRLGLIAMQAYAIGSQLAKDPTKAVLLPHVEEIKRLKGISRRKKGTQARQTPPAPAPLPSPAVAP
ncbi:MAG: hypothetical protein WB973_05900 [Thermoanaerobaculia bacterium]